ncbi:VOC family protein [Shewanella sp. NIFS-20-20]|uniref:VOC family protein n=1 Tax=Shewanella sp. NIFS-20-20 TaxID=2853806 RepID=UPI001C43F3FC|nr:VOC family protein [Shewanella sp. NIFS-20-20]MBV7316601.1 VOC family protein [Shewanella sp. NIFS-20-20]
MSFEQLMRHWPAFSHAIQAFSHELGLATLDLHCDHAALRVNDFDNACALHLAFAHQGEIISNNVINGRPIIIIKLDQGLAFNQGTIDCIELPYPGDKHYPNEGWEHIELVLPCQATTIEALTAALLQQQPQLASVLAGDTDIEVKLSSPKGEHERLANPTIAFKRNGLCIKVHPHSIEAVIHSEQTLD